MDNQRVNLERDRGVDIEPGKETPLGPMTTAPNAATSQPQSRPQLAHRGARGSEQIGLRRRNDARPHGFCEDVIDSTRTRLGSSRLFVTPERLGPPRPLLRLANRG